MVTGQSRTELSRVQEVTSTCPSTITDQMIVSVTKCERLSNRIINVSALISPCYYINLQQSFQSKKI